MAASNDNGDPWAIYWSGDHPASCIAGLHPGDQADVDSLWTGFAGELPPGASCVDLATGNGVVAGLMVRANPDLAVTGVDKAPIEPLRALTVTAHLEGVRFIGGVDLGESGSRLRELTGGPFDAVVSQFGLEYAGHEAIAPVLDALVAGGGRALLLLHHADSQLTIERRRDVDELDTLVPGVIEPLSAWGRNDLSSPALENAVRRFLDTDAVRTRRLSGDLIRTIDQLLTLTESGRSGIREEAIGISQRVCAEHERLQQLLAAALDAEALNRVCDAVNAVAALSVSHRGPFHVGRETPALLGWELRVERS